MFPFPSNGLRLIHDEKVCDAMEQARIDAEMARGQRRIVQLSVFRNFLKRFRSRPNIFALPARRLKNDKIRRHAANVHPRN
ncbi:MAG TPA: hypothetical protein VEH81_13115 [Ktedonobacteraceae bacterium]|nr:hypothetical protein [Ktedonobacteraceae bacterium]